MTIHISQAYKAFQEYLQDYDLDDKRIALKQKHILHVARLQRLLAIQLGVQEIDIALAELIGILHDIGRFEQLRLYDTFSDIKSEDHATLGNNILFGDANRTGIIRKFVKDDRYDDVIFQAIENHNKMSIQNVEQMDRRTAFHAKLIRDADKIDNFRTLMEEPDEALFGHSDVCRDKISDAVFQNFMEKRLIDRKLMKDNSAADSIACILAFIYDYNFDVSYKTTVMDEYLLSLPERYCFIDADTNEKFRCMFEHAVKHCVDNSPNGSDELFRRIDFPEQQKKCIFKS